MCYLMFVHTLRCDKRPLISDGKQVLVNPYAQPEACLCPQRGRTPPHLRCEHHGCCVLKPWVRVCDQHFACEGAPEGPKKQVHFYRQVAAREPNLTFWPGSQAVLINHDDDPWEILSVIDFPRFLPLPWTPHGRRGQRISFKTAEFHAALDKLLGCGKELKGMKDQEAQQKSHGTVNPETTASVQKLVTSFQQLRRELIKIVSRGHRGVWGITEPMTDDYMQKEMNALYQKPVAHREGPRHD